MNARKIYYRKKEHKMIIEGKVNGMSVYIWTLPEPETLVNEVLSKASFITREKVTEIQEKIKRLDMKEDKDTKLPQKIRIPVINRTFNKDAKTEIKPTEEQLKQLWELTK